jgi:hypothetical protein
MLKGIVESDKKRSAPSMGKEKQKVKNAELN